MDHVVWFFAGVLSTFVAVIIVVGTYLFNPKNLSVDTSTGPTIFTNKRLGPSTTNEESSSAEEEREILSESDHAEIPSETEAAPEENEENYDPPKYLESSSEETEEPKVALEATPDVAPEVAPEVAPKTVKSQEPDDQVELTNMFNAMLSDYNNNKNRIQMKTISPPSSIGDGKYASLHSYGASKRTAEEKKLISIFSTELCNRDYAEASEIAKRSGYDLHPLYVGISGKMPRDEYSDKFIGVRIKDTQFSYEDKTPSKFAIVTEIIDIGGMDANNIGAINL